MPGCSTALEPVVAAEGVLQGVQLTVRPRHRFDRGDLSSVGLDGQQRAGLHGFPVEEHRAAAAGWTCRIRRWSGETQSLPRKYTSGARLDVGLALRPFTLTETWVTALSFRGRQAARV